MAQAETTMFIAAIIIILIIAILASSIKIVREYERAVMFRLGRLIGAKGPGLFFRIPIIDIFRVVDLRVTTFDVPKQSVITKDNVTVDVDAVVYYRVYDSQKAVVSVENYNMATDLLAQATLRDVLGQVDLDELLSKREELGKRITDILDSSTDPWGIKVTALAIKDVTLPDNMQRAIAKQAEAERERRARIIIAEGEYQAANKMGKAALQYESNPMAMKLRELQTMTEIAREKNMVVVTTAAVQQDLATILGLVKAEKKKSK
jgi:regulator of protease activity HflC (stomatin/prohibitin superfamily)